jgi:hypothetical protein
MSLYCSIDVTFVNILFVADMLEAIMASLYLQFLLASLKSIFSSDWCERASELRMFRVSECS